MTTTRKGASKTAESKPSTRAKTTDPTSPRPTQQQLDDVKARRPRPS